MRQIKRLSWILLTSLSLNAILGVSLFYWVFQERPPTPICEGPLCSTTQKPLATHAELSIALKALKALSIEELIQNLSDRRVVENGFTVGDLSLGALTGFYFFDIERALPRTLEQKVLTYGDLGETLVVYPGLSESDFATLETFMRREKWPFRAQGLFRLIKNKKFQNDLSLQEAFYLTPEFLSVERLLARSNTKIERSEIFDLLLSGEWGRIAAFHEKQRSAMDLAEGSRRLFLLDWIEQGSLPAALILLKTDAEFAHKKLDDKITVKMLALLKDDKEKGVQFAEELLKSPRSDAVTRAASFYLPEKPIIIAPSLITEAPQKIAPLKTTPLKKAPIKITDRVYIVQQNDSLWKIAKRFNLNIETIRKMNGLTTDELKPGRPLRLPN